MMISPELLFSCSADSITIFSLQRVVAVALILNELTHSSEGSGYFSVNGK